MWRADGWDARIRLGLLVPPADVGAESEVGAMAPRGVAVHAARVFFGAMAPGGSMDPTIALAPDRAFAEPPHIDAAAELMAAAPVAAIGVRFTSHADVLRSASADLPSDQRAITPQALHAWVASEAPAGAEAVVIGGNGFRAVGAIEAIEADLGIPVVTANQALLWALLGAADGDPARVGGHGRLFRAG